MVKANERHIEDILKQTGKSYKKFKRKMKRRAKRSVVKLLCNEYFLAVVAVVLYLVVVNAR